MFSNKKKISVNYLINLLFCFFPISLIIGSLIVNVNLFIFLILSFLYIKKNNYKTNLDYTKIILTCFFLFIIITTFINIKSLNYEYAIKSVFLLRFLILYIIVEILLINNCLNIKKFFITCLLCTAFVSIDIIYQYIFGYDLFGYEQWEGQISGLFYSEGIGGSYIQKLSLFAIFGSIFLFKENYKKYLLFLTILLILTATFVATNRMSFLLMIFTIFLLFLFDKKNRPVVGMSFLAFIITATILINFDKEIKARYHHFYAKITGHYLEENNKEKNNEVNIDEKKKKKRIPINLVSHTRIFFTAYESWKNKPILGNGYKSFRIKCKDVLHKRKNITCSTHPHNYHLEALHDTGIIGFILLSMFVFLRLYKAFKSHFSSSRNKNYDYYFIPITILFISEIWPLKSSGMLFTTWNGTMVWLIIALTSIYELNKKNLLK